MTVPSARIGGRPYLRRGHPLVGNPRAVYPFFAGTGTTVHDISERRVSLSDPNSTTTWTTDGPLGWALRFDGASKHSAPTTPDVDWRSEPYTLVVFFKRDATAFPDDETIVAFSGDSAATFYQLCVRIEDGDGSLKISSDDSLVLGGSNTGINDGVWHSAILTKRGTSDDGGDMVLYLDGDVIAANESNNNINPNEDAYTHLGFTDVAETRWFTDGEIGLIAIIDHALPQGAVRSIHDQPEQLFVVNPR